MSIYKKLLEVSKNLTTVKRNGKNLHANYTYATEQDVVSVVAEQLKPSGLIHFVSYSECDVKTEMREVWDKFNKTTIPAFYSVASVRATLTIIDAESGEKIETHAYGYSDDKNGDKALFKAQTGASKYAYLKTFGLCSGEDPEREEEGSEPTTYGKPSLSKSNAKPQGPAQPPPLPGQAPQTSQTQQEAKELRGSITAILKAGFKGLTTDEVQKQFRHITGYDSISAIANNPAALLDAQEKLLAHFEQKGKDNVAAA